MKPYLPFALFSAATLFHPSTGMASIFTVQREITYDVHFSGPDFANASADVRNTYTVGPGSSGTASQTAFYPPYNQGITFFATGGVSVTPGSVPAGTTAVTNMLSVTGPGTYGFDETVLPASSYLDLGVLSSLAVYPYYGVPNLELYSPSNGLLDPGGTWITNVYFPGDWSQASAGDVPGTHALFYLDPLWSISSDFVYNPVINKTLFSAINMNYPGELSYDNGPYPDIVLVGSAVPEPGTGAMFGGVLLCFLIGHYGWTKRRHHRHYARALAA